MHRSFPVALGMAALVSFFSLSARAVRADDEDGGKAAFSVGDVALAEAGLPEGWKMGPSEPPSADEKAIRDEVESIAKAKAEETFLAARALATADGKPVSLVLVDCEKDPKGFSAAVKESAGKHGWGFRELGTPARLAIVAGPEDARAKALDAQGAYAVKLLGIKAESAMERNLRRQVRAFLSSALAIDPKSSLSHSLLGILLSAEAQAQLPDAKIEDGIAHLKAATAKDATDPIKGEKLIDNWSTLGSDYLLSTPPQNEAARDLLKAAMKDPAAKDAPRAAVLGIRYNLACAQGRLKEIDDSFGNLTAVLEEHAKDPVRGIEHWRKDPDFGNLQADARWAELLKKYPDAGGGDMGGN